MKRSLDINEDGFVTPLDALLIINQLNIRDLIDSASRLPDRPPTGSGKVLRYDVTHDGFLTPLDVLLVINFLNTRNGEGESSTSGSQVNAAYPIMPIEANWVHDSAIDELMRPANRQRRKIY